jgi:hypothetical protein
MPKPTTKTEAPASDDKAAPPKDDGLVRFQFRGTEFTIPRSGDDWDADAWIALLRNQYYQVAQYQLAATNQWAALKRLAPTKKDINQFLIAFSTAIREEVDFS